MKKRLITALVLLGVFFNSDITVANSDNMQNVVTHAHRPFFPGELLVKFKAEITRSETSYTADFLEPYLEDSPAVKEKLF